jgi:hypothetical protein
MMDPKGYWTLLTSPTDTGTAKFGMMKDAIMRTVVARMLDSRWYSVSWRTIDDDKDTDSWREDVSEDVVRLVVAGKMMHWGEMPKHLSIITKP